MFVYGDVLLRDAMDNNKTIATQMHRNAALCLSPQLGPVTPMSFGHGVLISKKEMGPGVGMGWQGSRGRGIYCHPQLGREG